MAEKFELIVVKSVPGVEGSTTITYTGAGGQTKSALLPGANVILRWDSENFATIRPAPASPVQFPAVDVSITHGPNISIQRSNWLRDDKPPYPSQALVEQVLGYLRNLSPPKVRVPGKPKPTTKIEIPKSVVFSAPDFNPVYPEDVEKERLQREGNKKGVELVAAKKSLPPDVEGIVGKFLPLPKAGGRRKTARKTIKRRKTRRSKPSRA